MKYYNTKRSFFIGSYAIKQNEVEQIHKLYDLLEKSGVFKFIENLYIKKEKGGRPSYNPYDMITVILYNFALMRGTLRDIETSITYDLRCIYIMQNETPTYKTIGNFINNILLPHVYEIFGMLVSQIFIECNLEMTDAYIDGSKFEADANKYKFVWKPTTFHSKLSDKVRILLTDEDIHRGIPSEGFIHSTLIANKVIEFHNKYNDKDFNLKENKMIKKKYELLLEYLNKTLEYEEKERICGEDRKSYFKTDHDATAMCLKDDYYSGLGSSLHAAYNVQLCVINGIITTFIVTQSRNDIKDFIPLLIKHKEIYKNLPKLICADAGYGSLENYQFIRDNNIENYVKHSSWQGNVSGRNPSLYRLTKLNSITCLNGNLGFKDTSIKRHNKNKDTTFLRVEGCNSCDFNLFCKKYMTIKDEDFRVFEVNLKLKNYIEESERNLLSVKGIETRVNRSCQVEGAFGVIKQNFNYERFRRTSLSKTTLEFMLVALGYNIRKLFKYYDGKLIVKYFLSPLDTSPEKFAKPSSKKLVKRAEKNKKKSVNEQAKSSYKYKKKTVKS